MRRSRNVELADVGTKRPVANTPVIRLEETTGAIVRDSRAFAGTGIFLSVPPVERKDVALEGNELADARMPVEVSAAESWPAARPVTKELCLVQFDGVAVDSQSRICLDILARTLERMPEARVALIGNDGAPTGTAEGPARAAEKDAAERVAKSREYLVHEKGIDASRVDAYVGEQERKGPEDIDKIEAEMVAGRPAKGNVETILIPRGAEMGNAGLRRIREQGTGNSRCSDAREPSENDFC